jgi:hypothetical protein
MVNHGQSNPSNVTHAMPPDSQKTLGWIVSPNRNVAIIATASHESG